MHPHFFSSPDPKGHVGFCHHFASVVRRPQLLKIFSSETTWPLKTTLWWNGPWVIPFQNCVRQSDLQPTWSLLLKIKKGDEILKIFISETTGPIGTKLCLNSPWMTPFRQSRHPTNMATVAKNRNGGMKFCFPLKLLGQLDSSFAKIIL
jgi:hypothetical protein